MPSHRHGRRETPDFPVGAIVYVYGEAYKVLDHPVPEYYGVEHLGPGKMYKMVKARDLRAKPTQAKPPRALDASGNVILERVAPGCYRTRDDNWEIIQNERGEWIAQHTTSKLYCDPEPTYADAKRELSRMIRARLEGRI